MNAAEAIAAAAEMLKSGEAKSSAYAVSVGGGSKTYQAEVATTLSKEVRAAQIIEAALGAVFAVYQKGGAYDEEAGDVLENFARENGIAALCGVKE